MTEQPPPGDAVAMPLPARMLVGPALVALLLVRAGCVTVVPGRLQSQRDSQPNVSDSQVHIVGATDSAVDTQTRDALSDLQTFWTQQFPSARMFSAHSGSSGPPPFEPHTTNSAPTWK